jgi:hypothetical protein
MILSEYRAHDSLVSIPGYAEKVIENLHAPGNHDTLEA